MTVRGHVFAFREIGRSPGPWTVDGERRRAEGTLRRSLSPPPGAGAFPSTIRLPERNPRVAGGAGAARACGRDLRGPGGTAAPLASAGSAARDTAESSVGSVGAGVAVVSVLRTCPATPVLPADRV